MTEWVCGPLVFRSNDGLQVVGGIVETHTHNFPHATLCLHGSARVRKRLATGQLLERVIRAGESIAIGADEEHEFTSLEDNTQVLCIFPHRNHLGEIVDTYVGWNPASQ